MRLAEEIARARQRVAELDRVRDAEVTRIAELEAEIAALVATTPDPPANALAESATSDDAPAQPARRSPDRKLQIFRELFRGREDVFPTRFESAKTGKHGYGPACANKFAKGLRDLPRVKCGECKNQKFFPADDARVPRG